MGGDNSATCSSVYCNQGWGEVLTHMSPYGYANFGVAFGLGLSVVGAAWGIWLTGSSLVGAAVKAPRIRSKNLIRYVSIDANTLCAAVCRHKLLQSSPFVAICRHLYYTVVITHSHLAFPFFNSCLLQCHFLRSHCYLRRHYGYHPCQQN